MCRVADGLSQAEQSVCDLLVETEELSKGIPLLTKCLMVLLTPPLVKQ